MNDAEALQLPARAKLNLVLRVVGRRADGYHLLETLFHAIDLHDDLRVARARRGVVLHVTADDPAWLVSPGPDNLVVRALSSLAAQVGYSGGFVAHLHKRIPAGAGLGGGSSDAAAALRLGNTLLGGPLAAAALHEVAVRLGADVPFFLAGGSQWGRGIGDELEVAHVPPMHFVLLVPAFGCPTAEVYKNHATLWHCRPPQDSVRPVTSSNTRDSAVRFGFCNELEQAAELVRPALAVLRRRVVELGQPSVRMTGSGSTLFVACDDEAHAATCRRALAPLEADGVRLLATRSSAGTDAPLRVPDDRGGGPRPGGDPGG
ncbi:MAG TPA: 4-(cytidine 5'-diphospho)-2-C-methyl-D-erythritol kinase [Planctomycetota bacterium]|nr:4-(cytidine 5'-diphospho)-2-C-methyl-D-erythritol kinase [Planctomycetota bacterium]